MLEYKGKVIKHWNNRDVAFRVDDVVSTDTGFYNVFGMWINIVDAPYTIQKDIITIDANKAKDWSEYEIRS
jgi:hypothetical protein